MTDPATASLLRLEVGRLRRDEHGHRFGVCVHVGRLAGPQQTCSVPMDDPVLDAGTRTDVVSRLLEAGGDAGEAASVWLTRPGEPLLQDVDLAWLSAAARAAGALDRRLDGFWSVTRTGWLDVRGGESRTWKRLRL